MHYKSRKRFGQHFLHDQQVINKIVNAIAPTADDHLVEIGPGLGALTKFILPLVKELEAIELDRDIIPELRKNCENLGNLKIYSADVLKFDFATLVTETKPLRIYGNLPYNISTPLLFHLLDYAASIKDMHFMLQKEVAERIAAEPNSEHYGPLTIMVQYYCDVKLLFSVSAHAFSPPPKVDSAFIKLIPLSVPKFPVKNIELLRKVVRQAFSQRRKMLHNSLKNLIAPTELEKLGIDPNDRPEQLTIEDFVKISNRLGNIEE